MTGQRTFLCGLTLCALASSWASGQVTVRRLGFLSPFSRSDIEDFLSLLRLELEKLGWTYGRNIILLEPRTTEGANDRLPAMAAKLVSQAPDLILVQSVPATRALMQATKSIPIVMAGVGNPVEYGIVPNLRKPGGNVTGSSFLASEYAGKLLQLLKEADPRLRSVAMFANPHDQTHAAYVKQVQADASASGIQLQIVEVSGKGDFEGAFAAIRSAKTQSILIPPEALIQSNRDAIAAFAQSQGLPLAVVGASRILPASRSYCLRASARRVHAPRRSVRRRDLEGCQARRSFHRATDAIQSRDQSQGGQGARPHDPAVALAAHGRGYSVADRIELIAVECPISGRSNGSSGSQADRAFILHWAEADRSRPPGKLAASRHWQVEPPPIRHLHPLDSPRNRPPGRPLRFAVPSPDRCSMFQPASRGARFALDDAERRSLQT